MPGSLNDILPDPISEENEKVLLELIKRKIKSAAAVGVDLLHAMEERFGSEAREVVRAMIKNLKPMPRQDVGKPEADLHEFCNHLDKLCAGTHCWQRVVDESDCIAYQYSRCMWAEVYRELGEPELGFILCASDEPNIKSFNPKLAFKRTKELMRGDEICDHIFLAGKE